MKLAVANNPVVTQGFGEENAYTIDTDNDMVFEIFRDRMYNNKELAPIREYLCNALDIHGETGQARPFEVYLPNSIEPNWRVRDFGTGLSETGMRKVFSVYLLSTKKDDNSQVGGWGLGSKSAFAYTDSFTVISYFEGTKSTWISYLNERRKSVLTQVSSEPTDEPSGLEIIVPVKPSDNNTFHRLTGQLLMWFPKGSVDLVGGEIPQPKITLETDELITTVDEASTLRVKVGPVVYGVPSEFFAKANMESYAWRRIILKAAIGEVSIPPAREQISLDEVTYNWILDRLTKIREEAHTKALAALLAEKSLWKRRALYAKSYCSSLYSGFKFPVAEFQPYLEELTGQIKSNNPLIKADPYHLSGPRGGPPRRIKHDNFVIGQFVVGLADCTDRVLSRLTHNYPKLKSIAQTENISSRKHGATVLLLSQDVIDTLGFPVHFKLSELEPAPKQIVSRKGKRVYKFSSEGHKTWHQGDANDLPSEFYWVSPGSCHIQSIFVAVRSGLFQNLPVFEVPKTNQSLLASDDLTAINLDDEMKDVISGYLDDPDFVGRFYARQVFNELCALDAAHFVIEYDPKLTQAYNDLKAKALPEADYRMMYQFRSINMADFEVSDPKTDQVFKDFEAFKRKNPLLCVIARSGARHGMKDHEKAALAKTIKPL